MRDWTIEAVMPRLADVMVEALDEGEDCGFLLIHVPKSERRPHRSEFGERQYYRRAGASSRPMEHFEIEDAFRRVSVPELKVEYTVEGGGQIYGAFGTANRHARVVLSLNVFLRNLSRSSARSAYVATGGPPFQSMFPKPEITVRYQPPDIFFDIEPATIHPGVARLVAPLAVEVQLKTHNGAWHLKSSKLAEILLPIVVRYGCLDAPMRFDTLTLGEAEILLALAEAVGETVYIVRDNPDAD